MLQQRTPSAPYCTHGGPVGAGGGSAGLVPVAPENQADKAAAMPTGREHSGDRGADSSVLGLEGRASLLLPSHRPKPVTRLHSPLSARAVRPDHTSRRFCHSQTAAAAQRLMVTALLRAVPEY